MYFPVFFPAPQHPWSHLALDFITNLLESHSNTIILVILDQFYRSLRLIPLPGLLTTFQLAEMLYQLFYHYFGLPEDVVSDRGPQFTSKVWNSFLEKLEATRIPPTI